MHFMCWWCLVIRNLTMKNRPEVAFSAPSVSWQQVPVVKVSAVDLMFDYVRLLKILCVRLPRKIVALHDADDAHHYLFVDIAMP